ncbi:MAG: hypothetical protein R2749_18910 [Acidimicrobiales bacterium]
MAEAVGQRGGQIPAVGGLFGQVGGGRHDHLVGQGQIPHHPFEHDPQQRGLDRRRGGGQLVEEQQPVTVGVQAAGP